MENYLNGIHYLATTVIEFGKDVGNGVWKGVGRHRHAVGTASRFHRTDHHSNSKPLLVSHDPCYEKQQR